MSHVRPGDSDYEDIRQTYDRVLVVAALNNEHMKDSENLVSQSKMMLDAVEMTKINVLDNPSRRLLKKSLDLKYSR